MHDGASDKLDATAMQMIMDVVCPRLAELAAFR